jgi:type I restriction enzyme S subunit
MAELASMPKYESYRDLGIDWLGKLPSGWEAIRMKFLFKDTSIKNRAKETLLSVTQNQGVIPRDWVENRMVMPSGNLESFKFIEKGDFAISLRSFEGGLEYCHHDGIISPAYTVLKAKRKSLIEGYYKYLFKSQAFISELQTSIVGIREGKNISYEELQYSLLPIPAENEQTAIANFLDKKTAQIDKAIAIKEKQIELLKERKQIVIQQAVTQGLNPDAPMKDSGVDWIGEIPESWDFAKLKYYIEILPGFAFKSELYTNKPTDIKLLRGINISPSYTKWDEVVYWPEYKVKGLEKYFLQEGDLVIAMDRPWVSSGIRVTEIKKNDLPCLLLQRVGRIRGNKYALTAYVKLLLSTNLFLDYFGPMLTGISVPHISAEQIEDFCAPIPPVEEQQRILDYLNAETAEYDEGISITQKQIEKLKEYKATLINSAVTGKIKVPGVA